MTTMTIGALSRRTGVAVKALRALRGWRRPTRPEGKRPA